MVKRLENMFTHFDTMRKHDRHKMVSARCRRSCLHVWQCVWEVAVNDIPWFISEE